VPKVLFISAEPRGLKVPKIEHVRALRRAVEPWVKWPDTEGSVHDASALERERLLLVKERMRVLPDASIEAIYERCAAEVFTHIHILAHGDHYGEAGEQRFGVALCMQGRPDEKQVVSGEQLAKALRAADDNGVSRTEPLVVTLATCDSGQQGSVLVPGGSIAQDLHAAGIPWVLASQFPLTRRGSVRMAEFLYPRLLRGDDPRLVLYELRRRLSMSASREHDWASLVTDASLESDFEREVAKFFESQTMGAIEVQMGRADNLARYAAAEAQARGDSREALAEKAEGALDTVRQLLKRWESRKPTGNSLEERTTRTNCLGVKGSTLKRMGLLHAALDQHDAARRELNESLEAYHEAMDEWVTEEARFTWTASQYLALSAVMGAGKEPEIYAVCHKLAERDLSNPDPKVQAWAHGTLAELELLSLFHDPTKLREDVEGIVVNHCRKIIELMGPDSFHVHSTRRQFERYAKKWQLPDSDWKSSDWVGIAKAAVEELTPGGPEQSPAISRFGVSDQLNPGGA
jgi:tetratricopeptide (TPR) repeat protein